MTDCLKTALAGALAACLAIAPVAAQTPTPPTANDPAPAAAEAARGRAEAIRLIDTWLAAAQAFDRVPSLSAAIVQGQDIVWSAGYGHLDAKARVPTTAATLYSVCSISKLFTSVALMREWEAGRVRLDEPVTTYLPWATFKPVAQDSVPITLRGILSHSAGLPRESGFPYWRQADYPFPTRDQFRSTLPTQEPMFPAGRWFQYSNLGLTLAGDAVEAVSGEPYAAYARKHLLDPLGLKDTHPFLPMDLYGTRLAVGWGAFRRDGTRQVLNRFDTRALAPAAGYASTVEDLGRFAAWQFRLLKTGKPEVLKASTLREMQRVQFTDPDFKTTWGLGFNVNRVGDRTYVGHGGDCPGYHATLTLRPDSETAITAMLTGSESPGRYVTAAFALLDKRNGYAFKTSPTSPPPAKGVDLEAYAGRYSDQPWGPETAVVPWAGGLAAVSLPSNDPAGRLSILKPKGDDVFRRVRDDGSEAEEVRFQRDRAGKVTGFTRFSQPQARIGDIAAPPRRAP